MHKPLQPKPNPAINHIIKTIKKRTDVIAIYCFAYQETCSETDSLFKTERNTVNESQHYWLLVIVNDIPLNFTADIIDTVAKRSSGSCTITPIFYTATELSELTINERCFIHKITTGGQEIYRKEGFVPTEWAVGPVWDLEAADKRWRYHKYTAISLLEAEAAVENPNGEAVQVVLLHAAMQHLCLGLVAVLLGHRPRHFALGYLLSLCACAADFAYEIFPIGSHDDQRLLKTLSASMNTLRYRKMKSPSITDVEILRRRAHDFREKAMALAEQRTEAIV